MLKCKTGYADNEESNESMSQRKLSEMSIDWQPYEGYKYMQCLFLSSLSSCTHEYHIF